MSLFEELIHFFVEFLRMFYQCTMATVGYNPQFAAGYIALDEAGMLVAYRIVVAGYDEGRAFYLLQLGKLNVGLVPIEHENLPAVFGPRGFPNTVFILVIIFLALFLALRVERGAVEPYVSTGRCQFYHLIGMPHGHH